jgi:hypothetical protein
MTATGRLLLASCLGGAPVSREVRLPRHCRVGGVAGRLAPRILATLPFAPPPGRYVVTAVGEERYHPEGIDPLALHVALVCQ